MSDHWQTIIAALEGKRSLERILSDERDGGAHQRNIADIDAALAFVREQRAQVQPDDVCRCACPACMYCHNK